MTMTKDAMTEDEALHILSEYVKGCGELTHTVDYTLVR